MTVPELISYARSNPGKLNFGAPAGATPLLVGELFKLRAGIAFTTVPYRGAANTMNDMLTGQIDMVIEPTSVSLLTTRMRTWCEHNRVHARARSGHFSSSDPSGLRRFRAQEAPPIPAFPGSVPGW